MQRSTSVLPEKRELMKMKPFIVRLLWESLKTSDHKMLRFLLRYGFPENSGEDHGSSSMEQSSTAESSLYPMLEEWKALYGQENECMPKQCLSSVVREGTNGGNEENLLPVSTQDLANTPSEKALNWKAFLRFAGWSVINIPPKQRGTLLVLCNSFLCYQVRNTSTSTPFDDFPYGMSTSRNVPLSPLSFAEAFAKTLPEMAHITKFIICYFLTLMLVWPLHVGMQIAVLLMIIPAPIFYFPELGRKASGIDVAFGSFKVPVIWFATLGAVSLSPVFAFLTLLVVYFSWRHMKGEQAGTAISGK